MDAYVKVIATKDGFRLKNTESGAISTVATSTLISPRFADTSEIRKHLAGVFSTRVDHLQVSLYCNEKIRLIAKLNYINDLWDEKFIDD